jgi:tRNA (guanine-N7-)-methyltransferase
VRKPARLPLEALAPYLFDAACGLAIGSAAKPQAAAVDWAQVFGNDHPVEIEVGFGKGLFLVTAAQAHPETNYLGIEVLRALQLYAATRVAKRKLTNVRVACTDARRFLHEGVPPGSVHAVHVYFPDPWWKKRHHKRRVWTPEFAADCIRVLRPAGKLHVATDVPAYFEHITELLAGRPELRKLWAEEQTGPPRPEEILTNFERKAREKGGSVLRAEYENNC